MTATATKTSDVLIIEPKVFDVSRGFFFESINQNGFRSASDKQVKFVQGNHSRSSKCVLLTNTEVFS